MFQWKSFLTVVSVIGLSACGSSSSPSSAASAGSSLTGSIVDICKLVTKADVEAAFGGTVGNGVPGKTSESCRFDLSGTLKSGGKINVAGGVGSVNVSWNAHAISKDSVVFKFATDPVPGLGVAYYLKEGKALFVSAKGGGLTYQASVDDGNADFARTALIQLATNTYQRN